MAVLTDSARESERLALKLYEEELRLQQDALLAQRLALSYACRSKDGQDDDVQIIMEVSVGKTAEEDTAELVLVDKQLAEVQNKRSRLEVEDLQEIYRYQERVARSSRVVAESLQQHERWRARVAQHDAAFARKLAEIDEDDWEEFGDEVGEPLDLPPPRAVPRMEDEPVPAAVYRASCQAAGCGASSSLAMTAAATTSKTVRGTAASTPPRQSARLQQHPSSSSCPPTAPRAHPGAARASGAGGSSNRAATQAAAAGQGLSGSAAAKAVPAVVAGVKAAVSFRAAATIECLICFDRFPETDVTCAGADAASSSSASAGCGHYFCTGCLAEYVRGAVRERKFPLVCPMAAAGAAGNGGGGRPGAEAGRLQGRADGGCRLKFSRDCVLRLLQRHPKELQALSRLEVEQAIDQSMRIYCPHKSCSALLVRPDPEEMPKDIPISCPACRRMFCVTCLIPGWHHGYTCAAFQALPPHLRSAEDAAMLKLSEQQRWKRCPQCKEMVERSEGCNHMHCRCGSNFCYACGKPYKDTRPMAGNMHGTPACGCPLFDVPDDMEEDERQHPRGYDDENYDGQHYAAAPAPWRGGRVVKRRRCRFSESIYNCPYGRRCWYWHEEEDGPL